MTSLHKNTSTASPQTSPRTNAPDRARELAEIAHLLADLQVIYQKCRTYHWNVRGPHFFALHEQFGSTYRLLEQHIDEIAERVVGLGATVDGSMRRQLEMTRVDEKPKTNARSMVEDLAADLHSVLLYLRAAIGSAGAANDRVTSNLLEDLETALATETWKLRAWLSNDG